MLKAADDVCAHSIGLLVEPKLSDPECRLLVQNHSWPLKKEARIPRPTKAAPPGSTLRLQLAFSSPPAGGTAGPGQSLLPSIWIVLEDIAVPAVVIKDGGPGSLR